MAKHFKLDIGEASFAFHRNADAIAAEAALDGIYVVRTSLAKRILDDAADRVTVIAVSTPAPPPA